MKSICDDVAIVGEAQSAAPPARVLCSIAAGVQRLRLDGGPTRWDLRHRSVVSGADCGAGTGPARGPLRSGLLAVARTQPPTIRPCKPSAAATLATHCAESAGSLDAHALWAVATSLRTTTLLGEFGIDADTGAQTKHTPVLLRWQGDQLALGRVGAERRPKQRGCSPTPSVDL